MFLILNISFSIVTISKLDIKQSKKKSTSKTVLKNGNEMNAQNEINQPNAKIKHSIANKPKNNQSIAKVKTSKTTEENFVKSDVMNKIMSTNNQLNLNVNTASENSNNRNMYQFDQSQDGINSVSSNLANTKEAFSYIIYGESQTKHEKSLHLKREILMKILMFLESDLTKMDVRLPRMKKKIVKYLISVCNNEEVKFVSPTEEKIFKQIQKRMGMVVSLELKVHNRE